MAIDVARILITGANGQLGYELCRALAPLGQVHALNRQQCDLADPAALAAVLTQVQPAVIVNAAAWTAVDQAERQPEAAFAANAEGPRQLAAWATQHDALLVHYSTDYVFDGQLGTAYGEDAATGPVSVYGQSKLAGELAVAGHCPRHLIFRTSWVYGRHGGNFLKTVLRLAAERDRLSMVADQIGAPTGAALIADVTAHALHRCRQSGPAAPYGLYHLTAAGETSWQQYARFVVAEAHALGMPLRLLPDNIAPIGTADYPLPARRPASSRLDCQKLQQTFGLVLPPWQDGVQHLLRQL